MDMKHPFFFGDSAAERVLRQIYGGWTILHKSSVTVTFGGTEPRGEYIYTGMRSSDSGMISATGVKGVCIVHGNDCIVVDAQARRFIKELWQAIAQRKGEPDYEMASRISQGYMLTRKELYVKKNDVVHCSMVLTEATDHIWEQK